MLTAPQVKIAEAQTRFHTQNVHATFLQRDKSKAAYEEWEAACADWHNSQNAVDFLWRIETRQAMHAGDREALESAICFLEVDPYYFRSGYLKEILLRELKRAPLKRHDRARLQMVLINAVRKPSRREFPAYLGLLQKVWTPDFEAQLLHEAEKTDHEWKKRRLRHYLESSRAQIQKLCE